MLALGPVIRDRIDRFLSTGVARDPQRIGKPLDGRLKGFWRYKIGTYRIICRIEKERLAVVILAIGHRRDVYKGL
jgi:mRNA interferase RelE/StbE